MTDQEPMLRVVVADDHPMFREGLAATIDGLPRSKVVGQAATGLEAVELAQQAQPDVIVMDLHMPQLNGIDATRHISQRHPQVAVLVLTMLEDEGTRVASLYRLTRAQIAGNVPSHWLPYVSTPDLSRSVSRAHALGGQVIVNAQRFPGLASIAVVADPTGALIGLWQSDASASPCAGTARDDAPATEGNR